MADGDDPPPSQDGEGCRDDKIGHVEPLNSGRIKKGEIRNPNGRAGKPKPAAPRQRPEEIVLREADRLVTVKIGNKIRRMPVSEAVVRRLWSDALSGNPAAARDAFRLLREAYLAQETHQREMMTGLMAMQESARREERDSPGTERWPHSKDMIVTLRKAEITGPLDAEMAEEFRNIRDMYRQMIWDAHENEELENESLDSDSIEDMKRHEILLKKIRDGFSDSTIKGEPVIEPVEKILAMNKSELLFGANGRRSAAL
jgi:hypothetical protein